ncbi:hypothetical protein ABK040_006980, partial [Willaertia magna]
KTFVTPMKCNFSSVLSDKSCWTDDVSNMNMRKVNAIHYPLDVFDIKEIVLKAKQEKCSVSIRGQKQTMGGHTIAQNGLIIDMERLNRIIDIDFDKETVIVEAGITWDELIHFLDQYGYSPSVLQSYVTFSVGGSIGSDIHGITSIDSLASSVLEIDLINTDGELVTCSEKTNPELFKLIKGGYGLFGVIYKVKLKIVPNVKIKMDVSNFSDPSEFAKFYLDKLEDKNNIIYLARVNLINGRIDTYIFPRTVADPKERYSSGLNGPAREMSLISKILYKWTADTLFFRILRSNLEKFLQHPIDWTQKPDRNSLLYESAKPLANLYSPFLELNRTHILQEYFVPKENFTEWYYFMMQEIHKMSQMPDITLLNVTIRYVSGHDKSFLKYAKKDVFSFVFYYRIVKNISADRDLETIHHRLVTKAIELGGTFYLPYRHHYSVGELIKAYPEFSGFVSAKKAYDPNGTFTNLWYDNYLNLYEKKFGTVMPSPPVSLVKRDYEEIDKLFDVKDNKCYQVVMNNPVNNRGMFDFLRYIFPAVSASKAHEYLEKINGKDDKEIYNLLQKEFLSSWFGKISTQFRMLKSLIEQKKEITGELVELLTKIGQQKRKFKGLLTFGDCGRFVKAMERRLDISDITYIVNDKERTLDIIERGSIIPVGAFIPFNELQKIPTNSVDLITCFIGLHHCTTEELDKYLRELSRVLRPNGLFILREHDGTKQLQPMLHVAHNTFNSLIGFSFEENQREYRHFRPMKEWNSLLDNYGFEHLEHYVMQKFDPTIDLMTCYVNHKTPNQTERTIQYNLPNEISTSFSKQYFRSRDKTDFTIPEWVTVEIVQKMGAFLTHTPWYSFPYTYTIKLFWKSYLNAIKRTAQHSGVKSAVTSEYFFMNIVVGVVTTFLLSQMGLLALLPRMLSSFSENSNTYKIEAILHSKSEIKDWPQVLNLLQKVNNTHGYFYHLSIPRYLPFTECLIKLSKNKDLRVVEIAGQKEINVKVASSRLLVVDKGSLVESYKVLPSDEETRYIYSVPTIELFDFLNQVQNQAASIQIHDF